MDHVVAALARIRSLHSRVSLGAPPPGFSDTLDRALAGAEPPDPTRGSPSAGRGTVRSHPGITLAQMLGRPLVHVAGAGSPSPVAPLTSLASLAVAPPHPVADGFRLPVQARMTSGFGMRVHPVTGEHRLHAGIDLAAPTGTPVAAAAGGTVSFAGPRGGYGNLVIVDHGDGTETRYAHQDTIAVTAGQVVAAGEILGTVGSTGRSTGPHLHFEVRRDGEPVDPHEVLGPGATPWTG